ncbi:uncharacterized protein LOC131652223 [Vicia villosa]|uniref:uncharacterized protein LOC131652223 n=1 Tax=Vicia villosa TaxID=3911 RepID=UPI00273B97EB|nr:uncharacterized protein LOC131652223 [Vicia villosa]XP_058778012.1 uncharacterized protein LOC131652223 [Vicia villosa]XP_058778013.1 uncharacterized protein LOC131652223 [Vicia villosa]
MGRMVTRSQRLKLLNHDSHSNDNSNTSSKRCKVISDSNNSNTSSKRCEVISKVLLPQDLMLHILTFVHVKCLINSARYVCKSWATTIRTSQFALACLSHSKPGIYVDDRDSRSKSYFLDIKSYVNGQFEFERTSNFRTPSRTGTVIASCNGILLLFRQRNRPTRTQIFLFNPVIKCCLRTPPLPLQLDKTPPPHFPGLHDRLQLVCQFTLVYVPHTAKFKLFFADSVEVVSGAFYYVFYVLTIGIDDSWRVIDRKEAPIQLRGIWKPLYDGSNYLYWTNIHRGIIVVDVEKEITVGNFSLPPVLIRPSLTFLYAANQLSFLWMGNLLSCVVRKHVDDGEAYHIYILDFDSGKWSLYHEMEPFDFVTTSGRKLCIVSLLFRFWIHDQVIFRVTTLHFNNENLPEGRCTVHFSYSVKTRKLTKIEAIAMANNEVWLHTNSLIALPSRSTPT